MSKKIIISEDTSEKLDSLSRKLGLRRNILCRLAIGKSLEDSDSVKDLEPEDSEGYEFNRYTLTGEKDDLFKALIIQHEGSGLEEGGYFTNYVRNHVERGIKELHGIFLKSSSKKDFFSKIINLRTNNKM